MQREIKFRGWDGEKMLPAEDLSQAPEYRTWLGKRDYTLMQFTGLHDKNGKEIYEGDIIKQKQRWLGVVKYQPSMFQFYRSGFDYEPLGLFGDEMEVIGDIYRNPELLKK